MNRTSWGKTASALSLVIGTALYVLFSGSLGAQGTWRGCCEAADQCQMAHYQPCDSAEDCSAEPCCDEYFSCLDDGYPEG